MPDRKRLTNSSDETDLSTLFSGDLAFSIPYFQRSYKWETGRLRQLQADLLGLVDGSSDSHFLGAIIIHGQPSNPSDPKVYEVIDGQQRLTTIFLHLLAMVRVLSRNKQYDDAAGLLLKYLVIGRDTRLVSNSKLHSCKDDRAQLNFVFAEVLADTQLAAKMPQFKYKPLPSTGDHKGRLRNNYRQAVRFLEEQVRQEGIERLRDLYNALVEAVMIVQIDVWDPTNGPKIFDSLNSHQQPMTTGDLVRNEIFSRVSDKLPADIEDIDQRSWQPFYGKFKLGEKSLFDDYFFPYGLVQDSNLRKSEVYAKLREQWKPIDDPEEIVDRLAQYQDAFLDAARGTNLKCHAPEVSEPFRLLYRSGAPSSTYPFLMQLSNSMADGTTSTADGVEVLRVVESFLVRRAICGHEPTGLHAVFKRLWVDCEGAPTKDRVTGVIKGHRTVAWPSDNEVQMAIKERALYGASVTRFLLIEWNRHVGGDQPTTDPWIEHVLPEKPHASWFDDFTRDDHRAMKDLLANLLPLSPGMNQHLGNGPYSEKRTAYAEDAGFKAARKFAEEYSIWTPERLAQRSETLAQWTVDRWPD